MKLPKTHDILKLIDIIMFNLHYLIRVLYDKEMIFINDQVSNFSLVITLILHNFPFIDQWEKGIVT